MSQEDWRSDAANAYLEDLSLAALCWEFLRRNDGYRAAFADARMKEIPSASATAQDGVSARRWGLSFPGRPGPDRTSAAHLLAA